MKSGFLFSDYARRSIAMQEQAHRGGDLREPSIVAARRERTKRPRLMRVPGPGRAHCWSVQGNVPPRSCRLDDRAAHERLEGHLADWNHHLAGVALKPFSQRRGSTDCRREARRAVVALTAARVLLVASAGSENSGKTQGKPLWIERMRVSSKLGLVRCKGSSVS